MIEGAMVKLIRHRVADFVKGLVQAAQRFGAPQMKLIPIRVEVRTKRQTRR
jgi:hypothetical protein